MGVRKLLDKIQPNDLKNVLSVLFERNSVSPQF